MDSIESKHGIRAAEIVLPCAELDPTLSFFTGSLGFRLEAIFPADAPEIAVVSGYGLRVRLACGAAGSPGAIRLLCDAPEEIAAGACRVTAPNGTVIEIVAAETPIVVPPLEQHFVLSRMGGDAAWVTGRAGMLYRDLIPGRLGGRFIASHILIPDGGPVPDYVHYHAVRFQMIYCRKGWVRLVYEDQGPPFVLAEGDCVLQPPRIRHRVLESSANLEVVEIGCPALHETFADNAMTLPTSVLAPEREFGGQHYVRHVAAEARWRPWRVAGFECRDTGIAEATHGLAGARVVRPAGAGLMPPMIHGAEFHFLFVLDGKLTLSCEGTHRLEPGDAATIPAGRTHGFDSCTPDLALLEVTLPGGIEVTAG